MCRAELDSLLAEIRTLRELMLTELVNTTEAEFDQPTDMPRWTEVRRVLLRFGDHMREHANQLEGARASTGRSETMSQRILAEAEYAWGKLLASTVGLTDDDLGVPPPGGGWSVREVLQHLAASERGYLDVVRTARRAASGS